MIRLRCRLALLSTLLGGVGCGSNADSGRVELRFWAMGREGEVVQELVRDFEREHPNIRVRVQQLPWTAAHEKLLTAFVGDATPDIAQLGNTWIAEFDALHALTPLDSSIRASREVSAAEYFPGIWDTNILDGRVLGIPWYVDTRLLFYRKDILARAGYAAPPATWAEWQTMMERIKQQVGSARYALFLPSNEWVQPVVLGLQAGSPILKDNAQYGAFSDSAFRRAFEFYVGLYRAGLAPVAGNNDVANPYQEFGRGLFAQWITGPWNIGEFERRLPPDQQHEWATAPLPGPDAGTPGISLAGGSSLVLFRRSKHPVESWQLIEFLSRPAEQLQFYRLTGDLPARTAAWNDSSLIGNQYAHAFWDQLHRVKPTPQVPEWELIVTKVFDYAEQSIRGGRPIDSTLAALDADVNDVLAKRRWMLAHEAHR